MTSLEIAGMGNAGTYAVVDIPADLTDRRMEPMGSREKFWYQDDSLGLSLFKQVRPGTGEDWSEKAAAELAELAGLPHARVELASWGEVRGVVSPTFVPAGWRSIPGNEVLVQQVPNYPRTTQRGFYRVPQHTVEAVVAAVQMQGLLMPRDWMPPPGITEPLDVMIGYLMLDTWIGNTDRHHEN